MVSHSGGQKSEVKSEVGSEGNEEESAPDLSPNFWWVDASP